MSDSLTVFVFAVFLPQLLSQFWIGFVFGGFSQLPGYNIVVLATGDIIGRGRQAGTIPR